VFADPFPVVAVAFGVDAVGALVPDEQRAAGGAFLNQVAHLGGRLVRVPRVQPRVPAAAFDAVGVEVPAEVRNDPHPGPQLGVQPALPGAERLTPGGQDIVELVDDDHFAVVLGGQGQQVDTAFGQRGECDGPVDQALQDEHDPHEVPAAFVRSFLSFDPFGAAGFQRHEFAAAEQLAGVEVVEELASGWQQPRPDVKVRVGAQQVQLLPVADDPVRGGVRFGDGRVHPCVTVVAFLPGRDQDHDAALVGDDLVAVRRVGDQPCQEGVSVAGVQAAVTHQDQRLFVHGQDHLPNSDRSVGWCGRAVDEQLNLLVAAQVQVDGPGNLDEAFELGFERRHRRGQFGDLLAVADLHRGPGRFKVGAGVGH